MGTSETARYGDGLEVYGRDAAWPTDVRARWSAVVDAVAPPEAAAAAQGVPGPATPGGPRGHRSLKAVLTSPAYAATLRAAARRWSVDEAEAAYVLSRCRTHDTRAAIRATHARLALVRHVEERVRRAARRDSLALRAATRLAIRTQLVHAAAGIGLDVLASVRDVSRFLSTVAGARFVRAALAPARHHAAQSQALASFPPSA